MTVVQCPRCGFVPWYSNIIPIDKCAICGHALVEKKEPSYRCGACDMYHCDCSETQTPYKPEDYSHLFD